MKTKQSEIDNDFFDEQTIMNFLGYKNINVMRVIRSRTEEGKHPPVKRIGKSMKYPKKLFYEWLDNQIK